MELTNKTAAFLGDSITYGLGIDPDVEADCAAYTIDGTHLNDAGHEKLAELAAKFLKEL